MFVIALVRGSVAHWLMPLPLGSGQRDHEAAARDLPMPRRLVTTLFMLSVCAVWVGIVSAAGLRTIIVTNTLRDALPKIATITIDAVIFNTERMSALCPTGSALTHDISLAAESAEEAQALLVAAFWDGPDFVCTPTPKPFVFYADHDDWITFYANKTAAGFFDEQPWWRTVFERSWKGIYRDARKAGLTEAEARQLATRILRVT